MMTRASIVICLLLLITVPGVGRADTITDWNTVTLDTISALRLAPTYASRALAMVHAAMYDAVNCVRKERVPYNYRVYDFRPTSAAVAAAVAAHRVLTGLFPERATLYDEALEESLAMEHRKVFRANGIDLGERVGLAMLELRSNDHSSDVVPYTPGTDPGDWQPTPPAFAPALNPNWPLVTPFAMRFGSQFRFSDPPSLDSPEYAEALSEVTLLGEIDSAARTSDQTQIAHFWSDGSGTVTPPGHWNLIAQQFASMNRNNLSQNACLFALLNIGLADAAISSWDSKYAFNLWRPITEIRQTEPDWTPLLVTPPFPECTSGHSTFSGTASTVLALFFGRDSFAFTLPSISPLAGPRSYTSISQAAKEAGRSRIYGGIHLEFSNQGGLDSGGQLGRYVYRNFLKPLPFRPWRGR